MEKDKKESGYIFGRNPVIEALQSGEGLAKIFITYGAQGDSIRKIYQLAKNSKVPCIQHDKRKFEALERQVCPPGAKSQGIIALTNLIHTLTIPELITKLPDINNNPIIVAMDGITDPHNFGAIARSAECAGAAGIIINERNSAPITPTAIKASAGALKHIPVAVAVNMINAIEKLKEAGFWIIGTDAQADNLYTDPIFDKPVVLLIGSEGEGIGSALRKHCDYLISIPLHGKISSLNASVSAGIMLFEIARQRM